MVGALAGHAGRDAARPFHLEEYKSLRSEIDALPNRFSEERRLDVRRPDPM